MFSPGTFKLQPRARIKSVDENPNKENRQAGSILLFIHEAKSPPSSL